MDDKKLEALREFFARDPDLGVVSAYLFGSHAENRAHRESDIDVAVLLDWKRYPTDRDRFEARVRLGSELIGVLHHNEVDLVVLNDVPPLFARKILYDGINVYQSSPEGDQDFLVQVQSRAGDLEPWLQRMRKIRLEALAQ